MDGSNCHITFLGMMIKNLNFRRRKFSIEALFFIQWPPIVKNEVEWAPHCHPSGDHGTFSHKSFDGTLELIGNAGDGEEDDQKK